MATYTEMYDNLLGQGIPQRISARLDEIHQKGLLTIDELDDRALEALKEFSEDDALNVLEQFSKSDLSHVQNKSAFLCGVMKTYRAKLKNNEGVPTALIKTENTDTSQTASVIPSGANEEKVKALLDRTGYTLDITTGQRKYGGPPPGWEGVEPGRGEKKFCSQVFIGKLPRDMYEDELVPFMEEFGTIYDLRIMMDHVSGLNKGYAFCTYTTKEAALASVKGMEKKEVRPGKMLGVCLSQSNNRLFVGSIPKSKTKKQIFDEFNTKVEALCDVIVYISSEDKSKNRGFAFLEFISHKDASTARRRLGSGKIKVFGNISPTVDWADPVHEPDEETMSKVKVVYVRNLSPAIDETKLNELFKQYGTVEKVKKIKDYAFIHFVNREDALRAIEELDGQELDDIKIEVSLAKPQVDKKEQRRGMSGFGALSRGRTDRGDFRGGPRGGRGRGRGGYAGYGGYDGGYDEGYGDGYGGYQQGGYGYDDSSYDDYYAPPPSRGRGGRGGPGNPRGMMPRGGPSHGGMRGRGNPRGMLQRGGYSARGAPPRGRGAPRGGATMAPKRKADYGGGTGYDQAPKRKFGADGWSSQPIAQQPLNSSSYYSDDYSGGQQEWYQDSYGQQWK
ncbi:heterogeneous nuclear ribonucleoprotein R-like [Hydractinia symbiolongicarpus]|uniref:heterogeneous nuclear ribonucleoprotein R-like n=1 Tax=Hydractinia symbiolongicarpus TaxID=13093 RepID=UPI002550F8AA|nr:heterogeneous nuclear ribonucleoprotein R-like [Hydractinia symbiolongicarpus]